MQTENIKKAKVHTRYYKRDGNEVPGTTTVLNVLAKPALVPWANKLGLQGIEVGKYVDQLAEIGTLAHYLILCHLKGEKPELSDYSPNQVDKAENSFLSYLEWEKNHSVSPHFLERPLVSEGYGFGGTPDFVGLVDGQVEVMDFKTGKAIYSEHFIQAAAYAELVSGDASGFIPQRIHILQIGRDESEGFSEKIITSWETEWQIFEHALAIYRLQRSNAKRK